MADTPARNQYLKIKSQYPNAILFFQMGDFYETFDEDARIIAKELQITLTSREMGKGKKIPLAGIPVHALQNYLARLIRNNYKVAICEQIGDSKTSDKVVERAVSRVVTPGTVIDESMLDSRTNNYLASVYISNDIAGLTYVDITTSEFLTTQVQISELKSEIERIAPAEILVPLGFSLEKIGISKFTTEIDSGLFNLGKATEDLLSHFGVINLKSFGFEKMPLSIRSAGAILNYLKVYNKSIIQNLNSISAYSSSKYMVLDSQTRRNLELTKTINEDVVKGSSLLDVFDLTQTSVGARLLKKWIGQPLKDLKLLNIRQSTVEWFYERTMLRDSTRKQMKNISDIERLLNRIRNFVATPRDLLSLMDSLNILAKIDANITGKNQPVCVRELRSLVKMSEFSEIIMTIKNSIDESANTNVGDGSVIKRNYSTQFDNLKANVIKYERLIADFQSSERERTGIKSLKVGYNKVFGYFLEVSNSNLSYVPDHYISKQTLVNAERFVTEDIKKYESLILSSVEKIHALEADLFNDICKQLASFAEILFDIAKSVAIIDVLMTFAEVAKRYAYTKPILSENDQMDITDGRHPVVERNLPTGSFVANDTYIDNKNDQVVILTGPNMAGKSTYIRQIALIVLIAQIGSFVPAKNAAIGIVDRIFSRMGLQDDITRGQSTFMVEMIETAEILNQATSKSLVILDEIGRGTSTYDGLAIAKAVAEYIHDNPLLGCKTLFATHYHELTTLSDDLLRVKNYTVAVTENKENIVFLRKVIKGIADQSYGVHVARLAGFPKKVTERANEILKLLNANILVNKETVIPVVENHMKIGLEGKQLPLLDLDTDIIDELMKIDTFNLSPLETANIVYQLQLKWKQKHGMRNLKKDLDGNII